MEYRSNWTGSSNGFESCRLRFLYMKRNFTVVLQAVVVLMGIAALAFLLWEPQVEGRNVHATFFQIYFNDPFLVWAYTASISFFVGLHHTFKLLGYVGTNQALSLNSVRALRNIRYCAISLICFMVPAVAYLFIVRPGDDIAGGVFMGLLISFISTIVAATVSVFEKVLQKMI